MGKLNIKEMTQLTPVKEFGGVSIPAFNGKYYRVDLDAYQAHITSVVGEKMKMDGGLSMKFAGFTDAVVLESTCGEKDPEVWYSRQRKMFVFKYGKDFYTDHVTLSSAYNDVSTIRKDKTFLCGNFLYCYDAVLGIDKISSIKVVSSLEVPSTDEAASTLLVKETADDLNERKVEKELGKGLSAEDYTTEEKAKLASLHNYDDTEVKNQIANKVEKVPGKGLSANDYTTAEKAKLASLHNYDDTEVKNQIANKVEKVPGMGLSANDYTTEEKAKLASLHNYDDTEVKNQLGNKVEKVEGKGLSTEDYTAEEKAKLAGIEEGAQKNVLPVQELGDSETDVVSQKGITNSIENLFNEAFKLRNAQEYFHNIIPILEDEDRWELSGGRLYADIKPNDIEAFLGIFFKGETETIKSVSFKLVMYKNSAIVKESYNTNNIVEWLKPSEYDTLELSITGINGAYDNITDKEVIHHVEWNIFKYKREPILIGSENVKDKAITPDKCDFFGSVNLFNPQSAGIKRGYFLNVNGYETVNSYYMITDYIPLKEGQKIIICKNSRPDSPAVSAVQYNSNLEKVKILDGYSLEEAVTGVSGVNLIRFTLINPQGTLEEAKIQIQYGDKETEYTDYGETILSEYISENSFREGVVKENSTIFFSSNNLFNPDDKDAKVGFLNINGVESSNSNYFITGYIPLKEGQKAIVSDIGNNPSNSTSQIQYDANKQKIYTVTGAEQNLAVGQPNVAFVRFTIATYGANIHDMKVQIEYGEEKTSYSKFGEYKIKEKYLPTKEVLSTFKNDICIPKKLYMLDGVQNNIFYEPLCKRWRPFKYNVRVSGDQSFERSLERVASIKNIKDGGKVTVSLVNTDFFKTEKSISTTIVSATPSVGSNEVVSQIIGDSYTNGAFFKDALITKGYVPNLKLIGLRKTLGTTQHDEGRGGWRLIHYFILYTDDEMNMNPFMQPDEEGFYWGCREFWINAWKVFRGTAPSGFEPKYSCGRYDDYLDRFDENTGTKLQPAIGDLQYSIAEGSLLKYDGSSWIKVTKEEYTWNFNYGKYLQMWNMPKPSILFELLGLNDFRNSSDVDNINFASWDDMINKMVDSYHKAVPNGIFVILIPCSTCGILDNAAGDYTIRQNAAMWTVRKHIIDTFDDKENENIFVVDSGISVDNMYGYQQYSDDEMNKPYSNYVGENRLFVQSGNPHPYDSYPEMGVCMAAFIQKYRK